MKSRRRTIYRVVVVFCLLLLSTAVSCRRTDNLPQKSTKEYNEAVRTFYIGLAALQVGHDIHADSKLAEMTRLVPEEPAGWANWGVLALRQRNYDAAAERLEKARTLAADNDQISYLIGLLESSRGRQTEALAALRRSVQQNPQNLIASYQLAQEVERESGPNSATEFEQLMSQILKSQPQNLPALLELARSAAKRNDAAKTRETLAQISAQSASWPAEVQEQLKVANDTANGPDTGSVATRIVFLRNVLVRVLKYRQDLAEIQPAPGEEATPLLRLLRLETPTFSPATPDTAIAFESQPVSEFTTDGWKWAGAISLSTSGKPALAVANGREIRIAGGAIFPFPGGPSQTSPAPEGVLPIDFNYDFKTDLVLAGAGGVRLMRQENPTTFRDVTSEAKLLPATLNQQYVGAWAADIEADGDLDIVLGSTDRTPLVLRNNGDATFSEAQPFANIRGTSSFVWADLDSDGDPDPALIDGYDKLHVFSNERLSQFVERALPTNLPAVRSITVADITNDGVLDLVVAQIDRHITRLSDKNEGKEWEFVDAATVTAYLTDKVRLRAADLDNNGGLDLLLLSVSEPSKTSGGSIWLSDERNAFKPLEQGTEMANAFDIADLNGDGRLDLVGLAGAGSLFQATNKGSKNYHWQFVRPRASEATGDQRINSFGIGGEIEVRSGLLLQKQAITGPLLHFGLGEQSTADVIRVVWPNGTIRAEFDVKGDQEIVTEQRLKGSCPFLFAYNGKEMEFVKDSVPWSSAIGLRINTLGTARVEATEEWYKIRGDQLVPRDGYYDLRITAELWETYYYDQLGLMVVDHPVGTDVFVDERFVIPPAKLAITAVATPRKIARAIDDNGTDVTQVVSSLDERYLDTFGRGRYQGVTRDHYVEIDLGKEVPKGPLYLIAHGWMHPTDSSINVAISQGNNDRARPLSLEVPDGKGGWVVAKPNLGFPAGRKKICLIDLSDVFADGGPYRFRLRTTLEVFWDLLEWAPGLPDAELKTTRLTAKVADLHFRGYSVISRANESSPELPDYQQLLGSKQLWNDLIGYYTRFGDVRELLAEIDDRYVIMNSGDEMSFRFEALTPAPAGWVRDFIIMGDGWIKDGDYNSTFSKTVLPLPYHAKQEYVTPPTVLEDEFVYEKYPEDWQKYHTRYVTPEVFRNALKPRRK